MSLYTYTMGKNVDLKEQQEKTLSTPVMKPNLILKSMYLMMDILYGFKRTLPKFMIIEVLARYPYWAWENGGYKIVTQSHTRLRWAKRKESDLALYLINLGRESQDNEQWHLMLIQDIMRQKGMRLGRIKKVFLPRIMAGTYYYLTRIMWWMNPKWSFRMNAAFESHAEHEYMKIVQEHPEWEDEPVDSEYFEFYPRQKSLADLFRRIGLDERDHMYHSLEGLDRMKE
jgi:ubiquinol oxidase